MKKKEKGFNFTIYIFLLLLLLLLIYVVFVCIVVAVQWCPTLCDSMDCSPPGKPKTKANPSLKSKASVQTQSNSKTDPPTLSLRIQERQKLKHFSVFHRTAGEATYVMLKEGPQADNQDYFSFCLQSPSVTYHMNFTTVNINPQTFQRCGGQSQFQNVSSKKEGMV